MRRAYDLTQGQQPDYDAAEALLAAAQAELAAAGAASPFVLWVRGVAADYDGRVLDAHRHLRAAYAADPLHPLHRKSLRVVRRRLSEALQGELGDLPTAERLACFERLEEDGAADATDHLAAIGLLRGAGQAWRAREVAARLTHRFPAVAEGWTVLATLAEETGDPAAAGEARARGAEQAGATPRFLS